MEIERKFLVSEPPAGLGGRSGRAIVQGYMVIGDHGSEARLRRAGDRRSLTVKWGEGLVRGEVEVELSAEQFERLWPTTDSRRLEKTRHEIPADGGLVIELDVYAGALTGLLVAEVEFPDLDTAARFTAPPWFGREVTDDDAYKNRRLAVDGRPPDASV